MSLRVDPNKMLAENAHVHSKKAKPIPSDVLGAKSRVYSLVAMVVSGSGVPVFRGMTGQAKVAVRVSIGSLALTTLPAANSKGEVRWDQLLRHDGFPLPRHELEIPDVFGVCCVGCCVWLFSL